MKQLALVLCALSACEAPGRNDGGPAAEPDAGAMLDAGSVNDAGTDAGVTWSGAIQPLLWTKCAGCHDGDGGIPAFPGSYPVMLEPSRLCTGERVGDCVSLALQAQAVEGTGCRTYVVRPFHREAWVCLSAEEVDRVVGWVDAGMRE